MGKDSSEIRREIASTRARMGDTVEALGYKTDLPSRAKDAVNERVETVKGSLGDVMDTVKNAVTGTTGTVGSALGGVRGNISDSLSDARDRVSDARDRVGDTVSNVDVQGTAKRAVGIAVENPIGLALGALAVGFLAGMLVPATDIENERLGPVRDQLVDRAQTVANDVVEHGKAVIAETAQAAVSSAQEHGKTVAANASAAS